MERIRINPRPEWEAQVEALGFTHHTINNKIFWNEHACYHLTIKEIEEIQKATNEIERLCLELVDHVISQRTYYRLNIPESAWPLIEFSWKNKEDPLIGRLDLCYDGIHPPKLYEYNADTPLCLLETSLIQKHWLEEVGLSGHQMNTIQERLVKAWSRLGSGRVHLTCRNSAPWLLETINYMTNALARAGLDFKHIYVEEVRWNGRYYLDKENEPIETLFKITPWEWMLEEVFDRLLNSKTRVIEPAWKMILSNKGFLVLLWELFPDHPNLLPAFFDPKYLNGEYVKKPLLGREGHNISLNTESCSITTEGAYGNGAYVYQQAHLLPNFDGNFPVIGSWLIDGESSGIIIREDDTPITRGASRVVPYFYC